MAVSGTGRLALEKLTLRGGYAEAYRSNDGGGILNYGGSLTLTDCTVSGNTAIVPYLGYGDASGGGVSNSGTLTLRNSTVSGRSRRISGAAWTTAAITTMAP